MKKRLLLLILITSSLFAEMSQEQKVNILTDYLMKHEHKTLKEARNQALATVYGSPKFEDLAYDNRTEMFFGKVTTDKDKVLKNINFYMPKAHAHSYLKNPKDGSIEINHTMKDGELKLTSIDLKYKGIEYPMALKSPTNMTLKIGGYFVADQDTSIYTKVNGLAGAINLQDLFGLESKTNSAKIDFSYAFNQRHKIAISYYGTKSENSKHIEGIDFDINGVTFDGADISLLFQTDQYKFNYIYSAYKTNHFEFNTRVGIHYTKFTTTLERSLVISGSKDTQKVIDVSIPTPLPVVGIGFEYEIIPSFMLKYYADYFLVTADIQGNMLDSELEFEYMYNDYVGLSVGIGKTTIDFHTQVDKTTYGFNHSIAGFTGALLIKY